MSNKIVSIIIVAGGNKEYLKSCLDSINEQTYVDRETIVIDNSLVNNFHNEFIQNYPKVRISISETNLFYSASLNKGIGMSNGEFILCLNDDVVLDKRFIEEAVKGFAVDKKIGMVSGKILRNDKETIDSIGLFLSIWRTARERGYGIRDAGQFDADGYIFGVCGAAAFYRRSMLNQLKIGTEYFDEAFRFFYEDLDMAWRAHNFAWKGYYVKSALAYHCRGGTARKKKSLIKGFARLHLEDDLVIDLMKNRYLAIIKNEDILNFTLHLPFIILYDILAVTYLLLFRLRLVMSFIKSFRLLTTAFKKSKLLKAKSKERG
jgi:GT2 family glycosyltransferase